ncbi:hypothetical protein VTO42DRAFT_8407 [Malbranchea cinnamomea]
MSGLKVGDSFPSNVVFTYVPWTKETEAVTACGVPQPYKASELWKDKKVVLFAVPGAFTPACSANHLPGYIKNLDKIKAKGVDIVAVIASNDAWVMSAWGKANNVTGDDILFLSDTDAAFSRTFGWAANGRTARYALIIDHGKITYAEKEPGAGVSVSGAEAVLSKL